MSRIRGIIAVLALAMSGTLTQSSPASKPAADASNRKRGSEGIKVSGYWTIEVKNPDGTVASHTEFENALQPNGMLGLAALLAGNSASGGFVLMLNGASTQFINKVDSNGVSHVRWLSTSPDPGPCTSTCIIAPIQSYIAHLGGVKGDLGVSGPTFNSTGTFLGSPQVVLTGNITAQLKNTINDAETLLISCFPSITPGACTTGANTTNANGGTEYLDEVVYLFTQKNLDGLNGDPSPVSVTKGQSIGITVTLTFQ